MFENKCQILNEDAKTLISLNDDSVDLIITSPPYANTYDYYLHHKHRMNWLGYDFNITKNLEIGSRNEYSSKKRPIETWNSDMFEFFSAMKRVVKMNGYICIVIGDSVVAGKLFNAYEAVKEVAKKLELNIYYHTSVSLTETTKKSNDNFKVNQDEHENVIILEKVKK